MNKKVLVIAAHPDDEVLGCGGTMALHVKRGDRVHVLILGEGITSRGGKDAPAGLEKLQQAAKKAHHVLGTHTLKLSSFPDNRMDSRPLLELIKVIEAEIIRVHPDTVYTHHGGDVNIDHRRVHEAVLAACRPQPGHPVNRLLFFEVASSTEWNPPGSLPPFHPNWFVDIQLTLAQKLRALGHYKSEMRPWPHPRSLRALEHLARWRGASAGFEAAEAFVLGRERKRLKRGPHA